MAAWNAYKRSCPGKKVSYRVFLAAVNAMKDGRSPGKNGAPSTANSIEFRQMLAEKVRDGMESRRPLPQDELLHEVNKWLATQPEHSRLSRRPLSRSTFAGIMERLGFRSVKLQAQESAGCQPGDLKEVFRFLKSYVECLEACEAMGFPVNENMVLNFDEVGFGGRHTRGAMLLMVMWSRAPRGPSTWRQRPIQLTSQFVPSFLQALLSVAAL